MKSRNVVFSSLGKKEEYPTGFCEAYSQVMGKIAEDDPAFTFLEIFPGSPAPLSRAVASVFGVDVPKHRSQPDSASARIDRSQAESRESSKHHPESKYRREAIAAAKQPSYGKRAQLIPDGLGNPRRHLERARQLEHPFSSQECLKEDHAKAIEFLKQDGRTSVNVHRLRILAELKGRVASLSTVQDKENARASWTARKLGLKPKTCLMRELQDKLQLEDRLVPDVCLQGLGIIGRASTSPFFEDFEVPPSVGMGEYLAGMQERNSQMVKRVRFMGAKADPCLTTAIYTKTCKEVAAGTMGPAKAFDEVMRKYGADFAIVPSFGLQQGLDSNNEKKYRRIDDHSACLNNQVAHRLQKVPMAMVDYVAVMLRSLSTSYQREIGIATEDMKGAYRQVPLAPDHVRYSITAVYNPHTQAVDLHEMYGQPFGAGHAVPFSLWSHRRRLRLQHSAFERPSQSWDFI